MRLRWCRLVALVLAATVLAAGEGAPLTVESVVRMTVQGTPESEILERIRNRETAFDLDPEMVQELRIAGISEAVIEAMLERDAAAREVEPQVPEPGPGAPAPETTITVRLRPPVADEALEDDPVPPLVFPAELPEGELAAAHGFGVEAERRAVTDLALFLLCRTADHVPDQWRGQSPLGRDYVLAPRHRLLAFHAGASRVEVEAAGKLRGLAARLRGAGGKPPELLSLELPETLQAGLEADVAHDLSLGIGALVDGRWIVLVTGDRDGVVPTGGALELAGTARSRAGARGVELQAELGAPPEAGD